MSVPHIAFFNNKGGVGKTSLVYHIAWMFADQGMRVLAADLDPQANLTAMFLEEDRLEQIWEQERGARTIHGILQPLLRGVGDITDPEPERIQEDLSLLIGDLALSGFEDELSNEWARCLDGKERAFRVLSAFWRAVQKAQRVNPELERPFDAVLLDLGPNLGAINRAALIAADYVVVPLSPDLFSLQGLRNLGPTLRTWRKEWRERLGKKPEDTQLRLPEGKMEPAGYVVLQHAVRLDRPVKAYEKWIARIPSEYHRAVLDAEDGEALTVRADRHCLALLKHYRSLMPLAQEARKPIFHLKPADGAIGAHVSAVQDAERDFRELAARIAQRTGLATAFEASSSETASGVAPLDSDSISTLF